MKSKIIAFILFLSCSAVGYTQGVWTQKANFGAGAITEARAFAIGNYGYFGGPTTDLWRYDPVTDTWTQMAAFTGPVRSSPVAFSIGNKGYLGTGNNYNDFYEYDAASNTWTSLSNFGGSGREGAVGIAIGGKGYVGTGGSYLNDWWEYDPVTDTWTQKANLAGPSRYHAGAFTVGMKGYVSTGFNGSFFNDLLEYDPALNTWTAKSPLPGNTRDRPVGLGTDTKGYLLTGWTGSMALNDLWEYDPVTDSWTALPPMPTSGRYNSCGFTIGAALYIGTGYMSGTVGDFWEYGPDCSAQVQEVSATCAGYCDGSAGISAPDPGAVFSYLWSNGQSNSSVINLCAGTYSVTVTDTSGCVSINSFVISEPPPIPLTSTQTMPSCAGDSNGVLCAIPGLTTYTLQWANGDTTSCLNNILAGNYTVTVTDSSGCNAVNTLTLSEPAPLGINFNVNNATCSTCANGTASAQVTGGTQPLMYSWSNGSTLAFINNLLPGMYQCCVTDVNNCSVCDSVEVLFSVGIDEIDSQNIEISPNPFNEMLTVNWNDPTIEEYTLFILDINGKTVLSSDIGKRGEYVIDTKNISAGVYYLKFDNGRETVYRKIIKNR